MNCEQFCFWLKGTLSASIPNLRTIKAELDLALASVTIDGKVHGSLEPSTPDVHAAVNDMPLVPGSKRSQFTRGVAELINSLGLERPSDTPDYILAGYLTSCLDLFNDTTAGRKVHEGYHG